jgi:hypothetical protein
VSTQPPAQTEGSSYARAAAAQAAGRYDEAVQLLWQASRLGDVNCMSLLGAQLISGRGVRPDLQAGARLIMEAAERGGAYACALASILTAVRRDWPRALDYLQRSAELGHEPAQAQLKFLARFKGAVRPHPSAWSPLRRRIDMKAWNAAPPARPLSVDPSIEVVERFLAADVCDWLVERGRERMAPAMVLDANMKLVRSQIRSNSAAAFALIHMDLVMMLIWERVATAWGLSFTAMEGPQVLHYAVGQQFAPHEDFLYPEIPDQAADIAARGQRAQTLLVYLNEGFEGGETDFPTLGLKFKGRKGDALMFANVLADGSPDRRMRHAGLPPTAGEKWLLSQWIRDKSVP